MLDYVIPIKKGRFNDNILHAMKIALGSSVKTLMHLFDLALYLGYQYFTRTKENFAGNSGSL